MTMTGMLDPVTPAEAQAAQAYVKRAEAMCGDIPGIAADTPLLPIEKVAVIGAGTMGGGIAMNFANVGIPVTLIENNEKALERGMATIRRNYERSASKGRLTQTEVAQRMSLLAPTLDLRASAGADLLVEAVFEEMQIKQDLFRRIDAVAKPGAILASNTSHLDINEIASVTSRPEMVIGLHFFSPANVMTLLEVVRGERTADRVVATSMALGRRIGKIPVLVRVCEGFVGNRILFPRQEQAYRLLAAGAMPWDVDQAFTAFGFPMGPFAMADLAGLDVGWSREKDNDPKNIRDVLCMMDRRGQKTSAGFYDYDANRRATASPLVQGLLSKITGLPADSPPIEQQVILERCLFPMVNEAARILEDGIAVRPSDIDVIWLRGYGWPAARGGLMYWAEAIGLERIASRLRELADRGDLSLNPSAFLRRAAAAGGWNRPMRPT